MSKKVKLTKEDLKLIYKVLDALMFKGRQDRRDTSKEVIDWLELKLNKQFSR